LLIITYEKINSSLEPVVGLQKQLLGFTLY